jgi:hypothetical protein
MAEIAQTEEGLSQQQQAPQPVVVDGGEGGAPALAQQQPPPPAAKGIGAKILKSNGVGDAGDTAMPVVGLGTWQAPAGEIQAAILAAIRSGYRHIDGAACYGNEKEVGEALEVVRASFSLSPSPPPRACCLPAVGENKAACLGDRCELMDERLNEPAVLPVYVAWARLALLVSSQPRGWVVLFACTQAFSTGLVTREEMFITSKLWNSEHAPQDVEAALRITLAELRLQCVHTCCSPPLDACCTHVCSCQHCAMIPPLPPPLTPAPAPPQPPFDMPRDAPPYHSCVRGRPRATPVTRAGVCRDLSTPMLMAVRLRRRETTMLNQ